jgi:hypothetical protein
MNMENKKEVDKKCNKPKKFRVIELGGTPGVVVSSWEEEQEARQQGYENFYYLEKPKRKRTTRKRKWLSGRPRYGRYDGIFEVK